VYPKIMTAGPHQSVVVANEEQERALPKEYGGLAGCGTPEEPIYDKDDLQQLCESRGIKFDKRWGIDKLLEALA